jgi:hypothetical protein
LISHVAEHDPRRRRSERDRSGSLEPGLLEDRRERHPGRGATDQRHRSRDHAEQGVLMKSVGDRHPDEVLDQTEPAREKQEDQHLDSTRSQ